MSSPRRMMGLRLTAILVAALLVGACTQTTAPGQTGAPAAPKTVVFGSLTVSPGGCDGTTLVQYAITFSCPTTTQEALVTFDWATNSVKPGLATSWDEKPDSITFKLRAGVTFHDGTPFNADAVVFNLRRVYDKSHPANLGQAFPYAFYVPFKSVDKVDDMTVRVNITPTPNAIWSFSFLATLMQSPKAVEAKGKDYAFSPVGTGPYKIVSFEDKVRWEVARYENYWNKQQQPAPDRIIVLIKSDAAALANDVMSGNIDVIIEPPVEQTDQMKSGGLQVQFFPTLVYNYFGLNTTKAPFDDVRVRQAANYAFDKEALVRVSKGSAQGLYSAWFEGAFAYNADVPQYKFDPAKARQLLDEAGWRLPASGNIRAKGSQQLVAKFFDRTGRGGVQAAQVPILHSNLQDVGFKIETELTESAVYLDKAKGVGDKTRFDIANFGHGSAFPDPQIALQRWTSENIPPAEFNVAFYSSPKYDSLVYAARTELAADKRLQLLKDAQKVLRDDAPIIWTSRSLIGMAWNPKKITAIPLLPTSIVDLWAIKLP
jgi:peptide/nickel transport system substrate-binding protein